MVLALEVPYPQKPLTLGKLGQLVKSLPFAGCMIWKSNHLIFWCFIQENQSLKAHYVLETLF